MNFLRKQLATEPDSVSVMKFENACYVIFNALSRDEKYFAMVSTRHLVNWLDGDHYDPEMAFDADFRAEVVELIDQRAYAKNLQLSRFAVEAEAKGYGVTTPMLEGAL
jgi:hypothetical protein